MARRSPGPARTWAGFWVSLWVLGIPACVVGLALIAAAGLIAGWYLERKRELAARL